MNPALQKLKETTDWLLQKGFSGITVGVILGSGLNELVSRVKIENEIPYSEIPNFPVSTVDFHKGKLIVSQLGQAKLLIMQGRFHYYEGYTMQQVVFPVRVMHLLGVKNLFITNASGGLNPSYKTGDFVLIKDHINLHPENPLRGENISELGDRFPSMHEAYDSKLSEKIIQSAKELNIHLHHGIYAGIPGPSLETPSEQRFLRSIGGDVVGMSTIPEVIAANHCGMHCAAISVITNECNPGKPVAVSFGEIVASASKSDKKLSDLLVATIIKT
jgi:purine-nucleoside phosphorylase